MLRAFIQAKRDPTPERIGGIRAPRTDTRRETSTQPVLVDYILGAKPGGGVFVVAYSDDPLQAQYLQYYKLGEGPYYLFYRPYHLCSFETGRAIASAFLYEKPILRPTHGCVADVYAYAKRDLEARETIESGTR